MSIPAHLKKKKVNQVRAKKLFKFYEPSKTFAWHAQLILALILNTAK